MATAPNRSRLSTWLTPLRRHPRLSLGVAAALVAALAVAIHLALAAEEARKAEAERALERRLRQETRLQLLQLQRQEAELAARERRQQQWAAQDTRAFQQAALEADLASQARGLRIQRRVALERQAALVKEENERRRRTLQDLMRSEAKTELEKQDSAACITAYAAYKASKRDPATAPEKLAADLKALRDQCGD